MSADEVGREVARLFLAKPKRKRAKPHRCIDCGRVTKHVRCPACTKARRA